MILQSLCSNTTTNEDEALSKQNWITLYRDINYLNLYNKEINVLVVILLLKRTSHTWQIATSILYVRIVNK